MNAISIINMDAIAIVSFYYHLYSQLIVVFGDTVFARGAVTGWTNWASRGVPEVPPGRVTPTENSWYKFYVGIHRSKNGFLLGF